jgi:hypothetical protein
MKSKRNGGIWEYLKSTGALDKGEDAILAAKKEWKRIYNTRYKAERRKRIVSHVISLSQDEDRHLKLDAKKHDMNVSEFIKRSAMAYTDVAYVVRDQGTIRKMESLLIRSLSALEEIGRGEKKSWFAKGSDLDDAKRIVATLRADVMRELMKPALLMTAVRDNPAKWQEILKLINDSKEHRG